MKILVAILTLGIIFSCNKNRNYKSDYNSGCDPDTIYVYNKNLHQWGYIKSNNQHTLRAKPVNEFY